MIAATVGVMLSKNLSYFQESQKNKLLNQQLQNWHRENLKEDSADIEKETLPTEETDTVPEKKEMLNYQAWLTIPGTNIDYPVVQGDDNQYYLNHDVYGNPSVYGSIYMDAGCTLNDASILIFGHKMTDGQMFTQLLNYTDSKFTDNHKNIYFNEKAYHVIGVLELSIEEVTEKNYIYHLNLFDNEQRINLLHRLLGDIPLSVDDQFLILSTCKNTEDLRTVIVAKLLM